MKKRRYLHEQTAEKLSASLADYPDGILPSIDSLARQFHVSRETMSRAVHVLKQKGVLGFSQGKRILISWAAKSAGESFSARETHSSTYSAYSLIKDRIEKGTYPVGSQIPKVNYFTIMERFSPTTVCRALQVLCKERLIHRLGKKWIVGPPMSASVRHRSDRKLVVLMLVLSNRVLWDTVMRVVSHLMQFVESFRTEAYRFSLKIEPIFIEPDSCEIFAYGKEMARNRIAQLGDRYLGSLCLGHKPEHVAVFTEWVAQLCRARKPVIWLDYANFATGVDRAHLTGAKNFYRMYQEEELPSRIALSTLTELGHTSIGVADFCAPMHEWSIDRAAAITKLASEKYPGKVSIAAVHHTEDFWNTLNTICPDDFIDLVREKYGTRRRTSSPSPGLNYTVADHKGMLARITSPTALLEQGVTAIIAPNDSFARKYYSLLTLAGVSIPRDVSIISFDNDRHAWLYPISTIDFGFSSLGYRAAHIFIGDLDARADKAGGIQSEPHVIDYGSLARPRRRASPR